MQLIFWTALGAVAVGVELLTGTLYLLALAGGASVAALAAYFGAPLAVTVTLFALTSGLGVLAARKYFKPTPAAAPTETGGSVVVTEVRSDATLRVLYRGTHWDAFVEPGIATPTVGATCQIRGFEGNRIRCGEATAHPA